MSEGYKPITYVSFERNGSLVGKINSVFNP
jgi:hypothetical protein